MEEIGKLETSAEGMRKKGLCELRNAVGGG